MKFTVEQIAICPPDPVAAQQLLSDMGAASWVEDRVTADGECFGQPTESIADLRFNYDLGAAKPLEVEILHYVHGLNWMSAHPHSVSHLGVHCTESELALWRKFFRDRHIGVAQEVVTRSHTNPAIRGKRRYNYVIFNTRPILGVDIKMIVRIE